MKTEEIELTYPELAFITDIDSASAKEIFLKVVDMENVSTKAHLKVKNLTAYFDTVKSVDTRYDGMNKLIFCLEHKSANYKKYLSDKPSIKNKKFTGGKSVFYKICTPEQIQHAHTCLEASFKFLYPRGLNPKSLSA